MNQPKTARNAEIRRRVRDGETQRSVAEAFGLSYQRVYDIVAPRRRRARLAAQRRTDPVSGRECKRCGGEATERHHADYSRPLDVEYLCSTCHWAADREVWEARAEDVIGARVETSVLPCLPEDNQTDGALANTVFVGQIILGDVPGCVFLSVDDVNAWVKFLRDHVEARRDGTGDET